MQSSRIEVFGKKTSSNSIGTGNRYSATYGQKYKRGKLIKNHFVLKKITLNTKATPFHSSRTIKTIFIQPFNTISKIILVQKQQFLKFEPFEIQHRQQLLKF